MPPLIDSAGCPHGCAFPAGAGRWEEWRAVATYLLSPAVLCAAAAGEAGSASSAAAQQQSLASQTMWLVVHCEDRQGILAEVAQIIAENQFNIKV